VCVCMHILCICMAQLRMGQLMHVCMHMICTCMAQLKAGQLNYLKLTLFSSNSSSKPLFHSHMHEHDSINYLKRTVFSSNLSPKPLLHTCANMNLCV
jgi:hypothetical protein